MAKKSNAKNSAKKVRKAAQKHPKLAAFVAVLVVIALIAAAVYYFFFYNPEDIGADPLNSGTVAEVDEADLSVHFLELGSKKSGDCVLIKCGDTEVLIDAGAETGSAPTLKAYIDGYCKDGVLEYVISTHADSDHISAFVGNKSGTTYTGIFYQYEIERLIKFDNAISTTDTYQSYLAGIDYLKGNGTKVYTASQCYDELLDGAKRQYYLDEAQTISINILYNYYYYNTSTDENNHSVVTLLTQELESGNNYYLFTGDLEKDGESRLVDYYSSVPAAYKTDYNILPENVLLYKAGHHGSKTSSTAKLMAAIKPKNVVVCCCCGAPQFTTTDENTFPTQAMIDNVSLYTSNIYVTTIATGLPALADGTFASKSYGGCESMNGTIVFYYKTEEDGSGKVKLYCSNNDTVLKDTDWFKEHRTWNGI